MIKSCLAKPPMPRTEDGSVIDDGIAACPHIYGFYQRFLPGEATFVVPLSSKLLLLLFLLLNYSCM
jgi:hypothetical protein